MGGSLSSARWALVDMERRGTIERVARGVYRFPLLEPNPELGQLAEATLWANRRGALSHDTALDSQVASCGVTS